MIVNVIFQALRYMLLIFISSFSEDFKTKVLSPPGFLKENIATHSVIKNTTTDKQR